MNSWILRVEPARCAVLGLQAWALHLAAELSHHPGHQIHGRLIARAARAPVGGDSAEIVQQGAKIDHHRLLRAGGRAGWHAGQPTSTVPKPRKEWWAVDSARRS